MQLVNPQISLQRRRLLIYHPFHHLIAKKGRMGHNMARGRSAKFFGRQMENISSRAVRQASIFTRQIPSKKSAIFQAISSSPVLLSAPTGNCLPVAALTRHFPGGRSGGVSAPGGARIILFSFGMSKPVIYWRRSKLGLAM